MSRWHQALAELHNRWEAASSEWWASWVGSAALHLLILVLFALIALPLKLPSLNLLQLVETRLGDPNGIEVAPLNEISAPAGDPNAVLNDLPIVPGGAERDLPDAITLDFNDTPSGGAFDLAVSDAPSIRIGDMGDFGGRTAKGRAALSKAFGGTNESEAAVAAGLEWLIRHQREDGSWSFDHLLTECDAGCTAPGNLQPATIAATAMALLSFVGAGHTHESGSYQEPVKRGLGYVLKYGNSLAEEGDFRQARSGNAGMYSQGLTTIALCEIYGLTKDEQVGKQAREAVKFVVNAQNPDHGGWRYEIKDRNGDTSVLGWQVMALTSARMCRINVPARAKNGADRFLTSVSLNDGAYYGYTRPAQRASTTAVGLLCRMYHGWKHSNKALKEGVMALSQMGPSRDDMYYNYYATQVLHHWGGEEWDRWNEIMREELISTQEKRGHSTGSWFPRDPHGAQGGRLYMTTLAIMTLEVYYRHLPIYQQRSVNAILE